LEHRVDGIEAFDLSPDRSLIRITFAVGLNRKKVHVDLPALSFAASMAMVSKAIANITSDGRRAVIDVSDAEAGYDPDGGFQVEMTNAVGAPMTFGLEVDAAQRLYTGLGKALQGRSPPKAN